jgi:hypothetical protein
MKIADSESIRTGEQELISSIMEKIDGKMLASLAAKNLESEQMEFIQGDMVILNDRIVYKMDFKMTFDMSVMIDRDGNILGAEQTEMVESVDESDEVIELRDETSTGDSVANEDGTPSGESVQESLEDELSRIVGKTRAFWQSKNIISNDSSN